MKAEDLTKEISQLPLTAQILPKLMNILQDPEASADEVVNMIKLEPSISVQVLKISNSGYYGRSAKSCTNIKNAIAHIGLGETYKIVSSLVSKAVSNEEVEAYEIEKGFFVANCHCNGPVHGSLCSTVSP